MSTFWIVVIVIFLIAIIGLAIYMGAVEVLGDLFEGIIDALTDWGED